MPDWGRTCFIIMPFGKKPVGDTMVDFDVIYREILEPAVREAELPEGGRLEPYRTDQDFASSVIDIDMFQAIEYARIALVDITGLNANVFYELGVRHRARASGTVIIRQTGAPLPFDINKIKAFSYDADPAKAPNARKLIAGVLKESLLANRIDSPVSTPIGLAGASTTVLEALQVDATKALLVGDKATAANKLRAAAALDPANALLKVRYGIILRDLGRWPEALEQFSNATSVSPKYTEAWRERGIAENKLDKSKGELSLRRAVDLEGDDFDALSSLGGILKRGGNFDEALAMYQRAAAISNGHSYPLLNAITLMVRQDGKLDLNGKSRRLLARNELSLKAQIAQDPPYDAPWSFFDLAQTCLFLGDKDGFLRHLEGGVATCDLSWKPTTFRDTLLLLNPETLALPGLAEGLQRLDAAITELES